MILINLDIMINGFDQIKIKIKHYRIFLTCIPFVHQFVPIFLELYVSNFCSWWRKCVLKHQISCTHCRTNTMYFVDFFLEHWEIASQLQLAEFWNSKGWQVSDYVLDFFSRNSSRNARHLHPKVGIWLKMENKLGLSFTKLSTNWASNH